MVAGLALLGLLSVFAAGARAGRAAERQFREMTRIGRVLLGAVVSAGVIVGIQWLVLRSNPATPGVLIVLGVPGLLAGITVSRMAAVTDIRPRSRRRLHR
jgi:hypothetical protein